MDPWPYSMTGTVSMEVCHSPVAAQTGMALSNICKVHKVFQSQTRKSIQSLQEILEHST